MKTILGIDPGKNGGIAWHDGEQMRVEKMPDTICEVWELIDMIRHLEFAIPRMPGDHGLKAYIEQVHSSPQMGVKSAFTFGQGFGRLEMALTAAGIPFERVSPQAWQKAMGCLTRGDKNVSKAKAQELFPHLKITHATSDATLICEYGRRQNQ
jgi:hypothetical protein